MQTMRLHYNIFNQSEEPQKDPLSHYKTVRDGRRDVAAEALAHINLGTHLNIYNGGKVIQNYVLIQHPFFIQGKSSKLRTHMLLAFFHLYVISKVWSRASILGTLRKSDQSTISYTDYTCSPHF